MLLSIENISYTNNNTEKILDNISFKIEKHDIFFLIGPNGAGKTSLIRCILGIEQTEEGFIEINGDLLNNNTRLKILRNLGVLIENASFYGHLTVKENAYLIAEYYELSSSYADEALEIVGLNNALNKKGSQLSMGMKQRLGLALAIIHKPQLVILDEPTNNLDPQGILEFRNLILKLNKNFGVTFFITSHVLSEVEKVANRVAIIQNGQIKDVFSLKNFHEHYLAFKLDECGNDIIRKDLFRTCYFQHENDEYVIFPNKVNLENFKSGLSNANIDLELKEVRLTLEQYYLYKTQNHV